MTQFLQFLLAGLTVGAIYALVALGFTLIYNASHVVNFAQGEFVMIGGLATSLAVAAGVPPIWAVLGAIALATLIGALLYYGVIAPARGADSTMMIILTIGASLVIRGATPLFADKQSHKLEGFSGDAPLQLFGAALAPQALWMLGGMAAIVIALAVFMNRTRFGKAVIATSADPVAAKLVGVNVSGVVGFSFAASGAIGAAAGALAAPITMASYDSGVLFALKGFAAAVLGGIGDPIGAILGGLLIGVLESFCAGYISSAYKDAAAFFAIIIVLLTRPNGIFGARPIERV